jgi:hypothetical protein
MEPEVKKAIIIASIVIVTVMLIKHITNSPVSYRTISYRTVVVSHPNQPLHRYYNPYKEQYYN